MEVNGSERRLGAGTLTNRPTQLRFSVRVLFCIVLDTHFCSIDVVHSSTEHRTKWPSGDKIALLRIEHENIVVPCVVPQTKNERPHKFTVNKRFQGLAQGNGTTRVNHVKLEGCSRA